MSPPTPTTTLGSLRACRAVLRLKWHLVLGGLRGSTQQRFQTVIALVMSVVLGCIAGLVLLAIGRGFDHADALVTILLPVTVLGLGTLAAAAGVETTIDPRNLAVEPLTTRELGLGMLSAAVVGPAAFLAALSGIGVLLGWGGHGPAGWALTVAVVVAWWATLVLFSRTVGNLLGSVASGKFRQVAQVLASGAGLLAWIATQLLARSASDWDAGRWDALAGVARWTPPGQLGEALGAADRPGVALLHLLLGVSWLPLLGWASVVTTARLAASAPRPAAVSGRRTARPEGLRAGVRRLLPAGPVGAMAARTLTTKVRTPRQSVNTLTALVVGAGVLVIGPLLDGGSPDPRIVLAGGLLHFAVLFDGNNAYGMDGAPLWLEVSSGADARVLTRAKVLASFVVMALPALLVPVGLAVLSGGWEWLPAAWIVAVGSLLASAGVAVASATFAPVALPDSPNPLASGDAGQGCVAGLMLTLGLAVLAVVTAPVAIAVALASSRSVGTTTLAALLAPLVGALVLWGCSALSVAKLRGREAELVQHVTSSR